MPKTAQSKVQQKAKVDRTKTSANLQAKRLLFARTSKLLHKAMAKVDESALLDDFKAFRKRQKR